MACEYTFGRQSDRKGSSHPNSLSERYLGLNSLPQVWRWKFSFYSFKAIQITFESQGTQRGVTTSRGRNCNHLESVSASGPCFERINSFGWVYSCQENGWSASKASSCRVYRTRQHHPTTKCPSLLRLDKYTLFCTFWPQFALLDNGNYSCW
jgi:hypothetical protein